MSCKKNPRWRGKVIRTAANGSPYVVQSKGARYLRKTTAEALGWCMPAKTRVPTRKSESQRQGLVPRKQRQWAADQHLSEGLFTYAVPVRCKSDDAFTLEVVATNAMQASRWALSSYASHCKVGTPRKLKGAAAKNAAWQYNFYRR